ncbi:MAG: hypothetical protein AAGK04_09700 [Planctomycetota bacterium]
MTRTTGWARAWAQRAIGTGRRGVVSVLAMMLLILFASLTTAMAITSKGNIRTASTHLHVMRAHGAAETGLVIAEQRLRDAASRFVVARGNVDAAFAQDLWTGPLTAYDHEILDPPPGVADTAVGGVIDALAAMHDADLNITTDGVPGGLSFAEVGNPPTDVDLAVYDDEAGSWLRTPAVMLWEQEAGDPQAPAFQIIYAPLANGTDVRAIVTGYDFSYTPSGAPITRTVMKDFRMTKRVDQAVNSPTRIMVGKNVEITGNIGARYTDVGFEHGHPVVMKSDFDDIDATLSSRLSELRAGIIEGDVDGDNRLRPGHPTEGEEIPEWAGDPEDNPWRDATGDGFIDEFDVFINVFDTDPVDGRVDIDTEFVDGDGTVIDPDLAWLIDASTPDRNKNGVSGFVDLDGDGAWDEGVEPLSDYDGTTGTFPDQQLGYLDGFIDALDRYTKLNGKLVFKVASNDWTTNQPDAGEQIEGAIRPNFGEAPQQFSADETELPELDQSSFTGDQTALQAAADGGTFAQQVADNLDISVGQLATYVESTSAGTVDGVGNPIPRYERLDLDTDGDGLPDNWATAYYEKMPYASPNFVDWYYRPVYEGMTFRDVQIPMGTNALFRNCTFVGVTWVRTHLDNSHPHWTLYGRMRLDTVTQRPRYEVERALWGDDASEDLADLYDGLEDELDPPAPVLLATDQALDKGDIRESEQGAYDPLQYDRLPEPLVISGAHVIDTRAYSNNIRFHDCLFVGSLVSDPPAVFTHVRNKMQFTGKTQFTQEHPSEPDNTLLNPESGDLEEIAKSSLMAPNYSVDVGTFNSPPEQQVDLQGAVIAGVLDMRGNATIDGALLLTYAPKRGEGALVDFEGNAVGNPAWFNTSIGYFGPDDGDAEAIDPMTLPEVAGQRIIGYDTSTPPDGIVDVPYDETPPDGAVVVPFNGYGKIRIQFDPNMTLPDGIRLPVTFDSLSSSYQENKL